MTSGKVAQRPRTVGEDFERERAHLRALPPEPFPIAEHLRCSVDHYSRVQVKTNRYSIPVSLGCQSVRVELDAHKVRVWHSGRVVAEHERLYGRYGEQLELDHYLELLQRKPGAMEQCRALKQVREAGGWPQEYERLWEELKRRHGKTDGTRQLLEVLMLHRDAEAVEVQAVVRMALELGCSDAASIAVLLRQLQRAEQIPAKLGELGSLADYGQGSAPELGVYNALMQPEVKR